MTINEAVKALREADEAALVADAAYAEACKIREQAEGAVEGTYKVLRQAQVDLWAAVAGRPISCGDIKSR